MGFSRKALNIIILFTLVYNVFVNLQYLTCHIFLSENIFGDSLINTNYEVGDLNSVRNIIRKGN